MRCLSAVPHHDRGPRRAGNLENKVTVSVYKLMLVNFEQDEESRGETTDNNKVRVYNIYLCIIYITEERERERDTLRTDDSRACDACSGSRSPPSAETTRR